MQANKNWASDFAAVGPPPTPSPGNRKTKRSGNTARKKEGVQIYFRVVRPPPPRDSMEYQTPHPFSKPWGKVALVCFAAV